MQTLAKFKSMMTLFVNSVNESLKKTLKEIGVNIEDLTAPISPATRDRLKTVECMVAQNIYEFYKNDDITDTVNDALFCVKYKIIYVDKAYKELLINILERLYSSCIIIKNSLQLIDDATEERQTSPFFFMNTFNLPEPETTLPLYYLTDPQIATQWSFFKPAFQLLSLEEMSNIFSAVGPESDGSYEIAIAYWNTQNEFTTNDSASSIQKYLPYICNGVNKEMVEVNLQEGKTIICKVNAGNALISKEIAGRLCERIQMIRATAISAKAENTDNILIPPKLNLGNNLSSFY